MAASFRGMAGNGVPSSVTLFNKVKAEFRAWLLRFAWADFEPTAGNYLYSYIEDYITTLVAADLDYILLPLVAPASGTTPAWIFLPPYNVPLVTTDRDTYPYYLDPVFIARKQAMHDAIRNRVKNTWSTDWKNRLINWQSAEGSTGDENPYKGTMQNVTINGVIQPNPSLYNITDAQWNTYKRTQEWPQMYALLAADIPATNLLINPANDGQDSEWAAANIPNSGLKNGNPGHNFNNCGELQYSARGRAITAVLPKVLLRSELEGTPDAAFWNKQCLLPLVASYACHGGTLLCITLNVINSIIDVDDTDDFWIFDFGNAHLGFRNVADTSQGFIILRDIIDGYDTARFTEASPNGSVIDPVYAGIYSTKYFNITNNATLNQYEKDDRITKLIVQYFNPSRLTALQAALPNSILLPLSTDQDHNSYGSDFGINMIPDNYNRFIIQYSPNTTSTGYNRIGVTTGFHGRTCRAGAEQQFYFDSGLIGNATYNITFKEIWYYDEGVSTWALYYHNGTSKVSAGTQTNGGTNTWKKYTVTLTDLMGGGQLANSCDFTLKTESGSDTKFELIWSVRNSISSTGTPGTYILGTSSGTVCGNDPETLYTNGAFAIGQTLFYDGDMNDEVTGFTFVVNSNNIYNLNTSTGVVGSDTGTDCVLGTSGTYKLGNTLSSICGVASGTYYTDGIFAQGKILYSNASLVTAVTTYSYVVETVTGVVYNLNSSTGEIGAPTTAVCGGGISGNYRIGTDLLTICLSDLVVLYTPDIFIIGTFLFTDINLSIPLTGYTYIVNIENDYIYTVDTLTGQVTGLTSQNCNASNYIPAADDFSVSVSQFIKDDCDCP